MAIVTGSSSGMGRAIALALAQEGAYVVCSDLQPEASPKGFEPDKDTPTHEVIVRNGGKSVYEKCDMGKTADIVHLVNFAVEVSSPTAHVLHFLEIKYHLDGMVTIVVV